MSNGIHFGNTLSLVLSAAERLEFTRLLLSPSFTRSLGLDAATVAGLRSGRAVADRYVRAAREGMAKARRAALKSGGAR